MFGFIEIFHFLPLRSAFYCPALSSTLLECIISTFIHGIWCSRMRSTGCKVKLSCNIDNFFFFYHFSTVKSFVYFLLMTGHDTWRGRARGGGMGTLYGLSSLLIVNGIFIPFFWGRKNEHWLEPIMEVMIQKTYHMAQHAFNSAEWMMGII